MYILSFIQLLYFSGYTIFIRTYGSMYIHVHTYMLLYGHRFVYVCMYTRVPTECVYSCIRTYVRMYVCIVFEIISSHVHSSTYIHMYIMCVMYAYVHQCTDVQGDSLAILAIHNMMDYKFYLIIEVLG